jgi:hypothetical protein
MTTITPGAVIGEPHPAGKLASTLLSVAMAGRCEAGRFRRGKVYLIDGAVQRLDVTAGTLTGTVQGSQPTPYRVIVSVETRPRPTDLSPGTFRNTINSLMPQARDIEASCTCSDWESPCKHASATVLAFAHELVARPELLIEWRCGSPDSTSRPRIGARAERNTASPTDRTPTTTPMPEPAPARATPSIRPRAPEVPARPTPPPVRATVARQARPAPWESDDWLDFVGDPDIVARVIVPIPAEPVRLGRSLVGSVDLAELVRSAQMAIRGELS